MTLAADCSLPLLSRRNITVITFCKHLRLRFYCEQTTVSLFLTITRSLCRCWCQRNRQTASQRRSLQLCELRCTNLTSENAQQGRQGTRMTLPAKAIYLRKVSFFTTKSSGPRNESVTVINFYSSHELRLKRVPKSHMCSIGCCMCVCVCGWVCEIVIAGWPFAVKLDIRWAASLRKPFRCLFVCADGVKYKGIEHRAWSIEHL